MEKIEQEISSRPRFQNIISIPGSLERSLAVGTYILEIFPNIGRWSTSLNHKIPEIITDLSEAQLTGLEENLYWSLDGKYFTWGSKKQFKQGLNKLLIIFDIKWASG